MGHEKKIRIGLMQLEVELKNRAANRERVRRWMAKHITSSGTPTALVLPELWDVGYCLGEADAYADEGGADSLEFLSGLAKEYGVWFAGGSVLVRQEGKFYNRTLVVDPSGKLVDTYDKVHLLPFITSEVGILTGGAKKTITRIGDATCGNIICYDMRFPEWVRTYAVNGIDVLVISAEWTAHRMELWRTMVRSHAIFNSFYVVAINCTGNSGDIVYGGGSMACSPNGEVLFESPMGEDGGWVDLDLDALDETRNFLKVFESRRPDLYADLTKAK